LLRDFTLLFEPLSLGDTFIGQLSINVGLGSPIDSIAFYARTLSDNIIIRHPLSPILRCA
jgi:hypothetical protein